MDTLAGQMAVIFTLLIVCSRFKQQLMLFIACLFVLHQYGVIPEIFIGLLVLVAFAGFVSDAVTMGGK